MAAMTALTAGQNITDLSVACSETHLPLYLPTQHTLTDMAPAVSILPIIKSVQDAASYELTVAPYWNEFYQLPYRVLDAGFHVESLQNIYLSTNPLVTAFSFSLAIAPIFLLVSEINRNYSQVDRVWSILPTIYAIHYDVWAHMSDLPTKKLDSILAALLIWSARLTFNYWRKGGYSIGSEDYRWEIVQSKVPRPIFFLFNVTFISTWQSILLFLVSTPIYILLLLNRHNDEMTVADNAFTTGIITLVALTMVSDQQQWAYYSAREKYRQSAKVPKGYKREDLERGFNTTGLFSISRHPNFLFEQSVWVTLYFWSVWETYTYWNWTVAGAANYLLLFQGSTWLTEAISAGKYEDYKIYQKRVGRFLPKLTALFTVPVPDVSEAPPAKNTRSQTKRA